jgi:hypothetical protein
LYLNMAFFMWSLPSVPPIFWSRDFWNMIYMLIKNSWVHIIYSRTPFVGSFVNFDQKLYIIQNLMHVLTISIIAWILFMFFVFLDNKIFICFKVFGISTWLQNLTYKASLKVTTFQFCLQRRKVLICLNGIVRDSFYAGWGLCCCMGFNDIPNFNKKINYPPLESLIK